MKHKLKSNFNMNLESIQSHLSLVEHVDCKAGVVAFTLILKTNEFEIKHEISYRLKGDYELKYYRNQQMMKHILNGNLIVDNIPNEELVSLMTIDDNNNIYNKSIIALDFVGANKKLVRHLNKNKKNRLIIDKDIQIPELSAENKRKLPKEDMDEDDEEEEDEEDEESEKAWRYLRMDFDEEDDSDDNEPVVETTTHLENVGQTVSTLIGKGLEILDTPKEDKPQSPQEKKEQNKKILNSPLTFNEGMS